MKNKSWSNSRITSDFDQKYKIRMASNANKSIEEETMKEKIYSTWLNSNKLKLENTYDLLNKDLKNSKLDNVDNNEKVMNNSIKHKKSLDVTSAKEFNDKLK